MPLIDTYGWKFKMDVDFMTSAERALFKRLRDAGSLSAFKMAVCANCGEDIPKGKTYCKKQCKEAAEAAAAAKEQGEDGHG